MKWFSNRKLKYINTDILTELPLIQPDMEKASAWQEIIRCLRITKNNYICIDHYCYKHIPFKELKYTLEQGGYHLCISGAYPFWKSDYKRGALLYIQKEVYDN